MVPPPEPTPHHFDSPPPPEKAGPPLQEHAPDLLAPAAFGREDGPDRSPNPADDVPLAPQPDPPAVPPQELGYPDEHAAVAEAGSADSSSDPAVTPPPEVTEEMIAVFAEKLDDAIASGLVSPGAFAKGFIEEVGPDATGHILRSIGPDELVDAVSSHESAAGTAIVTRDGRQYVRDLWASASALL